MLSCDRIREWFYGKDYKFSKKGEEAVWNYFYEAIERNTKKQIDICIDNTNCKEVYIDRIIENIKGNYDVKIIFFDIPLWKAYYRNVKRWMLKGKWIPIKVIKNMWKSYKKIDKNKYVSYTL